MARAGEGKGQEAGGEHLGGWSTTPSIVSNQAARDTAHAGRVAGERIYIAGGNQTEAKC